MENEREVERLMDAGAEQALRIMVVDDDEDLLMVLRHVLESNGYAVTTCSNALAGLEQLRNARPPDLIVLDLLMPGMTGWEFRILQKREPRVASIPVLALSGDLSPQAVAVDATAHLAKPVDHDEFMLVVRSLEKDLRRRRAVARASEVQRLVSLGTLVGGIAHEINNPLTFMGANVEALQRELGSVEDGFTLERRAGAQRALERVRTGLDRIAAVVKSVSLFAFAESTEIGPTDVHRVLEASLQVASNDLRHCARVVRSFQAVPPVRANPASLGQVFLNLLLNAAAAVREQPRGDHEIRVASSTRGEQVVITFADSGQRAGGDPHVFDPLMADGTAGRMGLRFGLAVSRELVESMGGSIEIEADEPSGNVLRVVLPSCATSIELPPVRAPLPSDPTRRPSVLVIDDDPLICELFKAMLGEGHEVRAMMEPVEALALLRERDFDVVLCDVMMPELDGIALFERAVEVRPELEERFVFVTAGVFTEHARGGLRLSQRPVLSKPCDRRELLAVIRATLASAGA